MAAPSRPPPSLDLYTRRVAIIVIYSAAACAAVSQEQDMRQMRVRIFDELSKIVDPEINTSITDLELIDEVDIQADNVKVDLHLTSPFCPTVFGFKICQDIHDNLLKIDGVSDVKVNVSNHIAAEMINNQVNSSPNPKAGGAQQGQQQPPPPPAAPPADAPAGAPAPGQQQPQPQPAAPPADAPAPGGDASKAGDSRPEQPAP